MPGVNERAVRTALRATTRGPESKALEVLVLSLARQVDESGPNGPSARLGALYLSALRQLSRQSLARSTPATGTVGQLRATRLRAVPGEGRP
ncbi:hypothetical protein [Sinomonas sp. B1-1]|uniref:hypothetical protein n=1 Tax=Sinomonas sp. B1-1 TaxID=3141454 RepID=UPI003D2A1749